MILIWGGGAAYPAPVRSLGPRAGRDHGFKFSDGPGTFCAPVHLCVKVDSGVVSRELAD